MSEVDERRPPSPAPSRRCAWCRSELGATAAANARFCSQLCRQTAFRLRRRALVATASDRPMRLAYADPPYPGLSSKYYRHEDTFAGEVDHAALLSRLEERRRGEQLDGWALSTSARALRDILPLCPPEARVCAWVKPHSPSPQTYGIHNCWEPVIVVGGRRERPRKRDWLSALPARNGGELPGRKPIAFCAWLFGLLGMRPGDELDDLFPGSGVVGRCWIELSAGAAATSPSPADEPSPGARGDVAPAGETP